MLTVDQVIEKHYPQVLNKPWLCKPFSMVLRYLLHEREMAEFGENYPHLQGLEFVEQLLEYFNVSYSARDTEKERIPDEGKLVIIANHPIGSLDGLALIKLVSEVRRDIKVVANEMLMDIEPLHNLLLPLNKRQLQQRGNHHDHQQAEPQKVDNTTKNQLKKIHSHLDEEGALLIFPAGEVSRVKLQGVRDSRWHTEFLRIATSAKAPILPIFIDAKNSPLFYTVSAVYKPLATWLLVKEMFKQRARHLPIRIGELIPFNAYTTMAIAPDQQAKIFRKHLYRIGNDKPAIFSTQKAIAPPEDRKALAQAIKQCEHLGETSDGKIIYVYRYQGSSPILREIGRLREIAFRAVGEGSNKRRDIDQYDNDYYHLLLWDQNDLEIVGAYRLGDANRLTKNNTNQLYSASLFDYDGAMQPYFTQGLELGRSFIQPKYWGKRSLDYLWYGIGAFLKKHPQYRYLFGPVSLSNSFPDAAKDLLIHFYQCYFGSLQTMAHSKSPYRAASIIEAPFSGTDYKADFSALKTMLANMGVAIPTLYKQYTELCEPGGVQFLSFGVDSDFNNCVDGLVLVDITMLKSKKRERYMSYH